MPTMPAELIARLTQSRSADNRVIGRWVLPVSPFLPQISAEDKRLMASLSPLFTQALREKDSCLDEILYALSREQSAGDGSQARDVDGTAM